jgi:hypothetical protein
MTSCRFQFTQLSKLKQDVRKDALVAVDGGQRRKYASHFQTECFTHKLMFFWRGF